MKYTVLKLYGDGKWTEAAKVGDRDVAFACGQHISKQGFDVQIWSDGRASIRATFIASINRSL
jgi:hypothetical protein